MGFLEGQVYKDVLVGRDGWLFLYGGQHNQVDYLSGLKKPSNQSVSNFKNNIENRKDYCAIRNIKYLHVVFPSKPLVVHDKFPSLTANISSIYESYYDKNRSVIYPLKDLRNNNDDVFFKTDTHLNGYGSWLVLKNLLRVLKINAKVKPIFKDIDKIGDLSIMLGKPEKESSSHFLGIDLKQKIMNLNNFPGLSGNSGRIIINRNPLSISGKRILLFGDSFFTLMIKHFSSIFREVVFIRYPGFNKDIVDLVNPDIVITGNAERYLSSVEEDSPDSNYFLKYLDFKYYDSSKVDDKFFTALNAVMNFNNKSIYDDWARKVDSNIYRDLAVEIYDEQPGLAIDLMNKCLELNPESITAKNKLSLWV